MTTSYDQVAYSCKPQPQTHPDRLATLATLHGMTPQPVDACRVLEIGCNDGSNLIPHGVQRTAQPVHRNRSGANGD